MKLFFVLFGLFTLAAGRINEIKGWSIYGTVFESRSDMMDLYDDLHFLLRNGTLWFYLDKENGKTANFAIAPYHINDFETELSQRSIKFEHLCTIERCDDLNFEGWNGYIVDFDSSDIMIQLYKDSVSLFEQVIWYTLDAKRSKYGLILVAPNSQSDFEAKLNERSIEFRHLFTDEGCP